jgi:hypothetical protein
MAVIKFRKDGIYMSCWEIGKHLFSKVIEEIVMPYSDYSVYKLWIAIIQKILSKINDNNIL